jgi:predicted nucleic acid-binding protein
LRRRVLYDTNVLLDVVAARAPFLAASAAALDLVARGRIEGFVAGHAVTTLAYLLQREQGAKQARSALRHLLSKLKVAPTTDAGVRLALAMDLDDFEDAVCVASAQEAGCTAIVTRNPQHFRKAGLPALLPEALVAAEGDEPEAHD